MTASGISRRLARGGSAFAVAGLLVIGKPVRAQILPGDSILANVDRQFSRVQDMVVTLDIVAEMDRLEVPAMHVTMYYKRPDRTHFESEGFAMLPREGMVPNTEKLRARYRVEEVVRQVEEGRVLFRVGLTAKAPRTSPPGMALVVDPARWTVELIRADFADGRTITTAFENSQVEGVWLPTRTTVTIAPAPGDTAVAGAPERQPMAMHRQPLRTGTITILQSGYRLNTGLSDEIFRGDAGELKQ